MGASCTTTTTLQETFTCRSCTVCLKRWGAMGGKKVDDQWALPLDIERSTAIVGSHWMSSRQKQESDLAHGIPSQSALTVLSVRFRIKCRETMRDKTTVLPHGNCMGKNY